MDMARRQPSGPRSARITAAAALLGAMACLGCGRKPRTGPPAPRGTAPRPVAVTPPPTPARAPARVTEVPPVTRQPEPVQLSEVTPPEPPPPPAPRTLPEPPEPPARPHIDEPVDHLAMAETAMERDDCREALRHIRLARADDPDNLDLRVREAGLCNRCRQPRQAIALLIDLDARTRALQPVAAEMAVAYFALNEPGKAAMSWELRYILEPSAWDAAAQAAIAWIEAGVPRPARWWYEQARLAAPNSPEVQMLATVIESPDNSDP